MKVALAFGEGDDLAAVVFTPGPADVCGDGPDAYEIEEHVVLDRGVADPPVRRIVFVRRLPSLTHAEFVDHWTGRHAELARRHHPGLCRYVQHVVVRPLTPGAPPFDGVAELCFASRHDFETRMYDSPEGKAIIRADVATFIDTTAGRRLTFT